MQIEPSRFNEYVRSKFYELTYRIPNTSYEEIIRLLTKQLQFILHTNFTGIYMYNNWEMDKLFSHTEESELVEQLLNKIDFSKLKTTDNEIRIDDGFNLPTNINYYITKIDLEKSVNCYLIQVFTNEQQLKTSLLQEIVKEVKQFFSIVHCYHQSKVIKKQSDYLFDLTTRLHSTVPIPVILKEVKNELEKLYPTFTFYFLLSQEYDQCESVPVKTIEYGRGKLDDISTKAFMTGSFQQTTNRNKNQTYLYAPLNGSQGVYGVIQMIVPEITSVPKEEVEFITRFANTVGNAVERATLYQNSTRLVSDLQLINDTSHKLNSNLKLDEIIHIIKNQIISNCAASQIGFIRLTDFSNGKVEVLNGSTPYFYSTSGQQFAIYIMERIKNQRKSIFIGDFSQKDIVPFKSIMTFPMQISKTIYGAITILHEDSYFFSFEKFKLMESLVQHATLALSNTTLKEKLEKTVITDYLTKLYSRYYLDEKLNNHLKTDQKGTLILFDIDNFKDINDTFGHYTGDKVIKQVATIVKQCIRKEDTAARWGGEEFAVYLPEATIEEGMKIAERIRKRVERSSDPRVTLSSGVSSWTIENKNSVKELFIRADRALYQAKDTGKNRAVSEIGTTQEN